jgi:hypothetical protein
LSLAALIQLAISAAAVAAMVGLAAWATRGRGAPPLDEATARRWLADEFPGHAIEGLWLAIDNRGAVAKSGDQAFVLTRMGDVYAARRLPWSEATAARTTDGRVNIPFADPGAPRAVLALEVWPPQEFAA